MLARISCLALSAALLSASAIAAPVAPYGSPAMQRVDGNNVGRVRHSGGGAFVETRPGRWVEFADDGTLIHRFDETNRNRDAVNLYDPSRGARVRLDLRGGNISGIPRNGPPRFLYRITDVDPRRSNGWGDNGGWGEGGWGRPGGRPGGGGGGNWDRPGGGGNWGGRTSTVEVGPIWNQSDAEMKCRNKAREVRGEWTGQWWTTVQGRMSVCEIRFR
jgi:hypothetical protein